MNRSHFVRKSFVLAIVLMLSVTATANADTSKTAGTHENNRPEVQHRVYIPVATRLREFAYVGLTLRYDFTRWIRGTRYNDVRGSDTGIFDLAVSNDVLRIHWQRDYTENPYGWPGDTWLSFYSLSQSAWVGSSLAADPAWKWRAPIYIPRGWQLNNGDDVVVDGQLFNVAGPIPGYTAFGMPYRYWQLTNTQAFIMRSGSNYTQNVLPGDAVLRYDADGRRIMTYDNIKRTYYFFGQPDGDTVQYINQLTAYSPNWTSARVAALQTDDMSVPTEIIERDHNYGPGVR